MRAPACAGCSTRSTRAARRRRHEVHLFLTHYHLDHVCGLAYLPGVLPARDIVIHPPARRSPASTPMAAVAGLVRRPYNPVDLADLRRVRVEPPTGGVNEVAAAS